jgi:N4-gp56 family major capsid protein
MPMTTTGGGTNSTSTSTGQIPPGIQAYYDRNLLMRAVPADVHGRFGQNRPIKKANGNQIKFRRYELLPINLTPLTEGVVPSSGTVTLTDLTVTLNQYGGYLEFTDMVEFTNQDAVLTELSDLNGDQAGTTVDQIRRDVLVAGTNVVYTNGSARNTLNTVAGAIALRTAIRTLGRNSAKFVREIINATTGEGTTPIRKAYASIIHPDTEAQFDGGLAGYVPVAEYSSAMKAEEDEVGSFRALRFWQSPNAKVFGHAGAAVGTDGMISDDATNNDVYATLIFAHQSYGIVPLSGEAMRNIIKSRSSGGPSNPLEQFGTSGWKAITTTARLNENFMVRVEHTNLTTLT